MAGWCNSLLSRFAWGPATLLLLAAAGLIFSVGTGFFQLRHLPLWWHSTLGASLSGQEKGKQPGTGGITGFQSACTALAATLGTGNIAGVATAIAAGGPGAVFWMWISAFFGTMTGYAENLLAGLYRGKNAKGEPIGGAMFYIEQGLGCRWLALLFSFFCILGSLGMGDMLRQIPSPPVCRIPFTFPLCSPVWSLPEQWALPCWVVSGVWGRSQNGWFPLWQLDIPQQLCA